MPPSPAKLWKQAGEKAEPYRILMLEHGYVVPLAPWERKPAGGKTLLPCGLTHKVNWSEWRLYEQDGKPSYEARWCRTCSLTQARAVA